MTNLIVRDEGDKITLDFEHDGVVVGVSMSKEGMAEVVPSALRCLADYIDLKEIGR